MGVNYYLYVGPFVKCKQQTVERDVDLEGCAKCRREHTCSFCSKCGSERSTYTVKMKAKNVDCGDIEEAFEQARLDYVAFSEIDAEKPEGELWLIPNLFEAPGRLCDAKDDLVIEHDDIEPEDDMKTLEAMYPKHFNVLRDLYGSEYVTMSWGIITYAN